MKENLQCPKSHILAFSHYLLENATNSLSQPNTFFKCSLCNSESPASSGRWVCAICNFFICQKCAKAPNPGAAFFTREISCPKNHPLLCMKSSIQLQKSILTKCSECQRETIWGENGRFCCLECKYNLCNVCKPINYNNRYKLIYCSLAHPLLLITPNQGKTPEKYVCQNCSKIFSSAEKHWACNFCNYFICRKCRLNPVLNFTKCNLSHKLEICFSNQAITSNFICENCGNPYKNSCGSLSCKICNFNICFSCAEADKNAAIIKLLKCKKLHNLEVSFEKYKSGKFICDLCDISDFCYNGRWNCLKCEYDICKKCRELSGNLINCFLGHNLEIIKNTEKQYCIKCNQEIPEKTYSWGCQKCLYFICRSCRQITDFSTIQKRRKIRVEISTDFQPIFAQIDEIWLVNNALFILCSVHLSENKIVPKSIIFAETYTNTSNLYEEKYYLVGENYGAKLLSPGKEIKGYEEILEKIENGSRLFTYY